MSKTEKKKRERVSEAVLDTRYGVKRPQGAVKASKGTRPLSGERRASVLDARYGKAWRSPEDGQDAKTDMPEAGQDAKTDMPEAGQDAKTETRGAKAKSGKEKRK